MMIDGTTGNDSLTGTPEADWIRSYGGRDTLLGGAGDDVLHDYENIHHVGDDSMFGGEGSDSLHTYRGDDTLDGGAGEDTAFLTPLSDVGLTLDLSTGAGRLVHARGVVVLTGIERLNFYGGAGHDSIIGAAGADALNGGGGDDVLRGGGGDDSLFDGYGFGDDSLSGGAGNDSLWSHGGDDTLDGGDGVDMALISLDSNADLTFDLTAGTGPLIHETGAVVLTSIERLAFYGGAGQDRIAGGAWRDILSGDAGDDRLVGRGGDDYLTGGSGNDSLLGGLGKDKLNGNTGDDRLGGAGGNDVLIGFVGDDTLWGGQGHDRLDGVAGRDVLTGGAGHDWFIFNFGWSGHDHGWDTITDFDPVQDTIRLRGASLAGLTKGVLPEGAFAIAAGGVAQEADDRILYDSTTGALYWDTDGAGGADAVQFATVSAGLALAAVDFVFF